MKPITSLLTISTLSTLGIFIALPLFGLYADESLHLSAFKIGVLMSVWPATVFCLSFFSGAAADHFGYLNAVRFGFFLNVFGFLIMSMSHSALPFGVGLFLFGCGKSFFDSSIRVAVSSACEIVQHEKMFRLRYLLQNGASVTGPLIGVISYKCLNGLAFAVSSFVFSVCLAAAIMTISNSDLVSSYNDREEVSWRNRLHILHDRNLQIFIISGILILMSYGDYEGLMPVVISQSKHLRPEFGFLVSLNAVSVIGFQLIHMKFLKNLSVKNSMRAGYLLLFIGFLLFTSTILTYLSTLLATVLFSIGEALLFPCFDVLMTKSAPASGKASYFGAGELKQAGFFLGPLMGGWLLEHGSQSYLFIGCSLTIVLAAFFTSKLQISSRANL